MTAAVAGAGDWWLVVAEWAGSVSTTYVGPFGTDVVAQAWADAMYAGDDACVGYWVELLAVPTISALRSSTRF